MQFLNIWMSVENVLDTFPEVKTKTKKTCNVTNLAKVLMTELILRLHFLPMQITMVFVISQDHSLLPLCGEPAVCAASRTSNPNINY